MTQMIADLIARPDQITHNYVSAIVSRVQGTMFSDTRVDLVELNEALCSLYRAMSASADPAVRTALRDMTPGDPIVQAFFMGSINAMTGLLGEETNRRADDDIFDVVVQHLDTMNLLGDGRRTIDYVALYLDVTPGQAYRRLFTLQTKGLAEIVYDDQEKAPVFFLTPMGLQLLPRAQGAAKAQDER